MRNIGSLAAALTIVGGLSAGVALPVLAQTPGASTAPAASTITPSTPVPARKARKARVTSVEDWIKDLHTRLQITPAQEPQWSAMAQVMRDNAANLDTVVRARGQNAKSMNAVDDLRSYEQLAAAHEAGLQKLIPVFQTLYDGMSADQKKTVDAVFQRQKRVAAAVR